MHSSIYDERDDFLSIVLVSLLFHIAIAATVAAVILLRPAKEDPPPIPFFEMINVAPPPPPPPAPVAEPLPQPEPPPLPEPLPQPKPEPKPEPKPVPKPEPVPVPKPMPTPEPAPIESKQTAPSMDMPMDMPSDIKSRDMEMPAIRTVGNVMMDPQLQAYLNTLMRLLHQNFNPPSGTEIAKGTKSSVQFRISRSGEISEVVLRSSSGNSIWDRLAVRAVQITKPPPLPPSYAAENLPLIFDFREK
jgi:protein TonB